MGIWVKIVICIWIKICVFGSKYWSLGQVRLVWQIWPSGQELGSQSQAPGSMHPAPLVGSKLCASRRRTLRGLFFAKKSVLKLGIVDFLDFNKKMSNLDNSCRFGPLYRIQPSRRRTLRGLFFTKKSVLKLEIVDFLDFINKKTCQILIIPGVRRRRLTWLSPSPHPITPRKKTRRESRVLT